MQWGCRVSPECLSTHPGSQDQHAEIKIGKDPGEHTWLKPEVSADTEKVEVGYGGERGSFLLPGFPLQTIVKVRLGFIPVCTKNHLFQVFLGWEYSQII